MIAVLMGVSGSGKTTIGAIVALRLGVPFADADDYHTPDAKLKMAAGHPLDDADRAPWLERLHGLLRAWAETRDGGVLACSALKAGYRTTLSAGLPGVRFVLLDVPAELLEARLAARHHAYMNPTLLASQVSTLEVTPDLPRVWNDCRPDIVADRVVAALGR